MTIGSEHHDPVTGVRRRDEPGPTWRRAVAYFWPWSGATWVFVIWTVAVVVVSQLISARVASICAGAPDVAYCEQGESSAYSFTAYGPFVGAWFLYAVVWLITTVTRFVRRH